MPEPYWPKHKHAYTLSMAARNGAMARLRCRYCKTERYYVLEDLEKLLGDIECDAVTRHHRWRCARCNNLDTIDMTLDVPSAADRQKAVVRRLVRIDYIKRPVWRDEN